MRRSTRAASGGQGGFTLVELLVAMTVLGLLAAIAVPLLATQRRKAYDTSLRADLAQTAGEMEAYLADQGRYPTRTADYVTIRASPGNVVLAHSVEGRPGYCLAGFNPKGTANRIDTRMLWYDSVAGGLQPRIGNAAEAGVTTGACSYAQPNGGDRVFGSN